MKGRRRDVRGMLRTTLIILFVLIAMIALAALDGEIDLMHSISRNATAYIPAQCYTDTLDEGDLQAKNTCYPCHSGSLSPNRTFDDDLQLEYAFPAVAETNPWSNVFEDRSSRIAAVSDDEILRYIRETNYFDDSGEIALRARLDELPTTWDVESDGSWDGFTPDCYFSFDELGFDRDPRGGYTGWRAYAYYPFPTTHWPSGGGPNDALIRLPEVFRVDDRGVEDIDTYAVNLAIVESLVKRRDVLIDPVDEAAWGVDLDKNGRIGTADRVVFDFVPLDGRTMTYVGQAKRELANGRVHLAAGLFPVGTEFLSTVRYVDPVEDGATKLSARMKEVRLIRKTRWYNYAELEILALNDMKETADFPDRVSLPFGDAEGGLSNGRGWRVHGFIEDKKGDLRPQTTEELLFCTGCHGGLGVTDDSVFSFGRKLNGQQFQGGWFHWDQKGLSGINEPKTEYDPGRVQYEYTFYLMYTGGGDEFRANPEIENRFFNADGTLIPMMTNKLHEDIGILLYPSRERALELNKQYRTIVLDQAYDQGRDAVLPRAARVHDEIAADELETGVETAIDLVGQARDLPAGFLEVPDLPPVSDRFMEYVWGRPFPGGPINGYEFDFEGNFFISNYGLSGDYASAYIPLSTTMATRIIGANTGVALCYACHRIKAPAIPEHAAIIAEPYFDETPTTEPGLELIQLTRDAGTNTNAVWSPDGTKIAWASDGTGEFQIWVMDTDGSDKRQITRGPGVHGWPAWHPDGKRMVYWGYNPETQVSYLETINADGTGVVRVRENENKEQIDRPTYSPDGKYIAYSYQIGKNWDIWASDVNGNKHYRLTTDSAMETNPLWRPPDGKKIAFISLPQSSVYPPEDPAEKSVYGKSSQRYVDVSAGLDSPEVDVHPGFQGAEPTCWSYDGTYVASIVRSITNAGGEDWQGYKVYTEDVFSKNEDTPEGTPIHISQRNTIVDRSPFFSPVRNELVFWAWDRNYRATLWLANVDGSDLRQLTTYGHDMYPRWSHDGNHLVFESSRGGNIDIWKVQVH